MSCDHLSRMSHFRRGVGLMLVLVLGYVAGTVSHQPSAASAGVRDSKSKSRAAFESGGERSARILTEISSTLKRIDRRLERIEKIVTSKPKEKKGLTP